MIQEIKNQITRKVEKEIKTIWDTYVDEERKVLDTKGNELPDIDDNRREAIKEIQQIIDQYQKGSTNVYEFKTSLDSYNKRNNLWGFTSIKGQMFFNQLTKQYEADVHSFEKLLKRSIQEPKNIDEALKKVKDFEDFIRVVFEKANDKRKVPNPSSTGYFLSYFWQIYNPNKWPIMYTSQIRSFQELGIWKEQPSQEKNYEYFYYLNEEIKLLLSKYSKKEISNWDAEHAFWNYNGNPHTKTESIEKEQTNNVSEKRDVAIKSNFSLSDYLIPKISNLIKVGEDSEKSAAAKGSEYEKIVADIFSFLEFEVEFLGQGSGRNPDLILKFRQENTAFIVDAKAYGKGYSLGIDDRAIKEYILHHCPKLYKEGYKKVGFIIVSNSFKSNFDSFINEITWNTDIKRFILLTSEALLYLFAYKMKDNLNLDIIIEKLISCGSLIEASNIIEEFEDV